MGNKHSDLVKGQVDNRIIIKSYVSRNQFYENGDGLRAGSTLGLSGPYYGPSYYQEHTYDPRLRRKSASVIGTSGQNGDFSVEQQKLVADKENVEEKSTTVKNDEPKLGRLMSNTDDSGYNTFCLTDSDKSQRARAHGSRTSLLQEEGDVSATKNPATAHSDVTYQPPSVFPPPPHHLMTGGPPRSPNFVPYPQPPFFGVLPHPPAPQMFFPPPPNPNETKTEKKMRKKFEKQIFKQQQRLGSSNDVFRGLPPAPMMMAFMGPPPPPHFGGRPPPAHLYRTKSVDNVNGANFFGPDFAPGPVFDDPRFSTMPQPQGCPFAFPLPLPPPKCHSYSHSDVHSVLGVDSAEPNGHLQQPATHGRKGKAYYKEKRKTGAGSVDGLSLAGGVECHTSVFDQTVRKFKRGLSKSRKENLEHEEQNTKFEEERMVRSDTIRRYWV